MLTDSTVINADLTSMRYNVFLSSAGSNPNISAGQVPDPSAGQVPNPSAGQVPDPSVGTVSVQQHVDGAYPYRNENGEIQPGIFTKPLSWENSKSNCYNTYNINDGRVDHCELRGSNHAWTSRNDYNHEKNCEPCYNCKKLIDLKYYKCNTCCRAICGNCDYYLFNKHATHTAWDSLIGSNSSSRRN